MKILIVYWKHLFLSVEFIISICVLVNLKSKWKFLFFAINLYELKKKSFLTYSVGISNFVNFIFQVAKSKLFRREGADIHTDAYISLSQAVLGGTIKVPGIYGRHIVSVSNLWSPHSLISNLKYLKLIRLF